MKQHDLFTVNIICSCLLTFFLFCEIPCQAQVASSPAIHSVSSDPVAAVLAGARKEIQNNTRYQQTYERLDYPMGDVSPNIGVCTDLVIRSFRQAGIDFQQLLHEDRVAHPNQYPTHLWEYKKPDKNIDHRRCPNLLTFFSRFAQPVDKRDRNSWKPGDVIFFVRSEQKQPWHVGIISTLSEETVKMYHLFPPIAAEESIQPYGPIQSLYRWNMWQDRIHKAGHSN